MKRLKVRVAINTDSAIEWLKGEQAMCADPSSLAYKYREFILDAMYERKVQDINDVEFDTRWAQYKPGDMKG